MTEEPHGRTPSDLLASMPKWIMAVALASMAVSFAYILIKQPARIEYFGLGFGRTGPAPTTGMANLPESAVIAFNGECPEGWKQFEAASARFVVGAATEAELENGPAAFRNGSNGERLTQRLLREFNGTENVRLKPEEMPSHSHWEFSTEGNHPAGSAGFVFSRSENANARFNYFADRADNGGSFQRTDQKEQGEDIPHYNMPPYVALYYCTQETG